MDPIGPQEPWQPADDEVVKTLERLLRQLKILIPLVGQVQLTILELVRQIGGVPGGK